MRIVMLLSSFYPLVGGAEKQAQLLGSKLVQDGHSVTVLTRYHRGLKETEIIDGIRVNRFKVIQSRIIGKLAPIMFMWKTLHYVRYHRKEIDIIHAHQLSSPGLTAAVIRLIFKIPVVSKIAGGGSKEGCEIVKLRKKRFGSIRVPFLIKYTNCFIAISRAIEHDLIKEGVSNDKIAFIPNGVDTGKFDSITFEQREKKKRELKLPIDKRIILFIGRLKPIKGYDIVVDTWVNLPQDFHQNTVLIVLGDGELKNYKIDQMKKLNNVIFMGNVDNVIDYLQTGDCFILPSRYEGISNAILEAMACRLPVVVSRVGGNPDLIENQVTGILMDDPTHELAQVLLRLDKERSQKMGEKARDFVVSQYSITEVKKAISNLYVKIIGDNELKI